MRRDPADGPQVQEFWANLFWTLLGKNGRSPSTARHGSYRSGFAFGVLSFLAIGVVGVLTTILISRVYGVAIIGQFALVSAPVLVLWLVSTAKEQAALVKEITGLPPRHPRVTQLFSAVFTFSSALTITMAALSMFILWFVFRDLLHQPELVAPAFVNIAGYALVTNTGWNFDAIFSAFVAGRQLFLVRMHEALSVLVISVAVGLAWHSVWGLVIGTIGGSFTSLLQRIFLARAFVRLRLSRMEYREGMRALPALLRFGIKVTPGGIAQGISMQAGVWVLAAIGNPLTTVGAYSRAQSIPERLQQVNQLIAQVLYPTLVGRRTRGDGEGFDRALIDSVRYALVGTLLIAAVFGGSAHSLLEIFGPGFNRAAPALALLMLCPTLASVSIAQIQAFLAVGRPGLTSIIAVVRLLFTLALTVVLTPIIGITGPALAILAGSLLQVVWGGIALRPFLSQSLHISWPVRERFTLIVAYACGFGAAFAVEHAVPAIAGLLLSLPAGTLAYVVVFALGGGINGRDRQRLVEIVQKVRSWRDRRSTPPIPDAAKG
jgi:O-antigen/teichoic acid export membrane protein